MSVARHYSRHADLLARTYLDVAFEDVHGAWLSYLPAAGSRVLDVGAGVGRDARALAAQGYVVTAVEPSAPMRLRGSRAVQPFAIDWVEDHLPDLSRVRATGVAYDFALCSAVLMHISADRLDQALDSLAAVVRPGGRIVATLRASRPGDPPGVYHDHSDDEVLGAASKARLALLDQGANADRFNRADAVWRWFVFACSEGLNGGSV